jgi:hypothetical protein
MYFISEDMPLCPTNSTGPSTVVQPTIMEDDAAEHLDRVVPANRRPHEAFKSAWLNG